MKAPLFLVLFSIFLLSSAFSQNLIINEIDSDTESTDILEFIELKSSTPNFSLNGYIVVLYNGNGDLSYYTIDLNGYSTDANGLFLIGNTDVSPSPSIIFPPNTLQNGADGLAIYQSAASNFPSGTAITNTNLIDALVYDTDDADDTELLVGLGQGQQINEAENGNKDFESIQNNGDGTYSVKTPTAGLPNDGSTTSTKYRITISSPNTEYTEGDSFDISFTSDVTLEEDITINIAFTNGSFDSNDFTADNQVTIANGSLSKTVNISLVNDSNAEGDEYLKVYCSNLPSDVAIINNNFTIKIVDDDVLASIWGSPLNPTYDKVSTTADGSYYNSLATTSGEGLKTAIQNIIADPNTVRAHTYGDVWAILKEADQDPTNNLSVWLLYTEQGRAKSLQQTGSTNVGTWNREHVYPQSRGGFSDGTSTSSDGIDVYVNSSANDILHGHSDAHHLRASDFSENSSRSNKDYGAEYSGPTGNQGSWKGDVARSIFYMAIRYNALDVVAGNPDNSTVGQLGDLDSLIVWHRRDPPDDFEMNRNNVIYNWQKNRNPFIDLPELVEYIWGDKIDETWQSNVGIGDIELTQNNIKIYPNPVVDIINMTEAMDGYYQIIDLNGKIIVQGEFNNSQINTVGINHGLYFLVVKTNDKTFTEKFVKK